MFPHYRRNLSYNDNRIFEGNKEIKLKSQTFRLNNKTIQVLKENSDADIQNLKDSCINALNQKRPNNDKIDPQIYKIKAWCTIPTIKQNFERHKFVIPTQDSDWKKILESEWITNDKYHNKQSFFSTEELSKLRGSDESIKLQTLKDKCAQVLAKPFERTNFPAPKDFLDALPNSNKKKVDEFQEAAFFCTIPKTAAAYVKDAITSVAKKAIPDAHKKDYCYEEGKTVQEYSNVRTIDPLGGKSFWCAVRMIHYKSQPKPKLKKV